MLTSDELAAIRQRRAVLTEDGNWEVMYETVVIRNVQPFDDIANTMCYADASFIAHAPADIDRLLAEVGRLQGQLERIARAQSIKPHAIYYDHEKQYHAALARTWIANIARNAIGWPEVPDIREDQMDTREDSDQ